MNLEERVAAMLRRVSSRGQDEDNQMAPIKECIGKRGMHVGPDYHLKASASKGKHAGLIAQIIADAKAGLFDVLVIRAVDRLDRRGARYAWRIIGDLMDAGVPILSVAEPELERVKTDPMAEMMISIRIALAREEIRKLKQRIKDGHDRIDAGERFRGAVPAGYSVQGPKYARYLVKDTGQEEDAPRKRRRYLATEIVQALTDASTGTSVLKLSLRLGMDPASVCLLIRRPVYSTGRYEVRSACGTCMTCSNGSSDPCTSPATVVHRCEPLVKPEVQEAAIASMEARHTGDNANSRAIRKEDYSGAVFCGRCAHKLYRNYGGGRKRKDGTMSPKVRRYVCPALIPGGNGKKCMMTVPADAVDAAVDAHMAARGGWWVRSRLIQGDDPSARLQRLKKERDSLGAQGLPLDKMLAKATALYEEIEKLENTPRTAPRTVTEIVLRKDGTYMTEGERWLQMTPSEQRAHLLGPEFKVYAKAAPGRTGAVEIEVKYRDIRGAETVVPDEELVTLKEAS